MATKEKFLTTKQVLGYIEKILEDKFITGEYTNTPIKPKDRKCCVMGWINFKVSGNPMNSKEDDTFNYPNSIRGRSKRFLLKEKAEAYDIASVNNRSSKEYPQETPKQRVVALLKDMIEAGY